MRSSNIGSRLMAAGFCGTRGIAHADLQKAIYNRKFRMLSPIHDILILGGYN